MKHNLDYYKHKVNSHNHWKFKTVRRKFGWAGEGKFWALNNMIAESDYCELNISDPEKLNSISTDLDFDVDQFREFLSFLVDVARLVKNNEGCLTTDITQENLGIVSEERQRKRDWKKKHSTEKHSESPSTSHKSVDENQQRKVKETKLNKTIDSKKQDSVIVAPAVPTPTVQKNKFIVPTKQEVRNCFLKIKGDASKANCWAHDRCEFEADKFFDFYRANGWVQGSGKKKIVSWEAAVNNWIRGIMEGRFTREKNNSQESSIEKTSAKRNKTLPRIETEINFLFEIFLEGNESLMNVNTDHYNYLKSRSLITFDEKEKEIISEKAENYICEQELGEGEKIKLKMMKLFGVQEFFKQQNKQRKKIIFHHTKEPTEIAN